METFEEYQRRKHNLKRSRFGRGLRIIAITSLCLGFDGWLFGFGILGALIGIILGLFIFENTESKEEKVRYKWSALWEAFVMFSLTLAGGWFVIYLIFGSDWGKYVGTIFGFILASKIFANSSEPPKEENYDSSRDFEYDSQGNNITSQVYGSYGNSSVPNAVTSSWEDNTEDVDDVIEEEDIADYDYTDRGACCGNCCYYLGLDNPGKCTANGPDFPVVYTYRRACSYWKYDEKDSLSYPMYGYKSELRKRRDT